MHDQNGITFFPSGGVLIFCLVLVCLVALTLNQPEWLESQSPDQRPVLAVLWDRSNSMKTRDVIDDQAPGTRESR